MSGLDAWLAAMPVRELQERIRKLEGELDALRALEQAASLRGAPQPAAAPVPASEPSPAPATPSPDPDVEGARAVSHRRLSRERRMIIQMLQRYPNGAGPHDIGEALRQQGVSMQDNAVQTNMSRMVKAGQLVRVEQGRYRLPSPNSTASLLNGSAGGEQG